MQDPRSSPFQHKRLPHAKHSRKVQNSLWPWFSSLNKDSWKDRSYLESTDAAPEVPHPRPTWRDAGRSVRRGCPRVRPCLHFFFFFSRIRADSAQFTPMRLDSCRIGFDSRWTGLIRPKSDRIRSYRPTANTAETGWKWPKSDLNMAGKAETCILLSFFVNQDIVCVF